MIGPNDEEYGPRFFSLANAYDKDLRAEAFEVGKANGIHLNEGVFVSYTGPNFETAAEIVCDHQHGRRLGRCRIVSRPNIEVREASRSRFHSLY